jgi:hypothetical protein
MPASASPLLAVEALIWAYHSYLQTPGHTCSTRGLVGTTITATLLGDAPPPSCWPLSPPLWPPGPALLMPCCCRRRRFASRFMHSAAIRVLPLPVSSTTAEGIVGSSRRPRRAGGSAHYWGPKSGCQIRLGVPCLSRTPLAHYGGCSRCVYRVLPRAPQPGIKPLLRVPHPGCSGCGLPHPPAAADTLGCV